MLTAPDETGEGAKIDYLGNPSRYRHLDPHVFDRLAAVVRSGERSTRAIEAVGVLEGAHFVSNRLGDDHGSRAALFEALWEEAAERSLLFFDPDIGLAGKSVRKGGRRSAMYLFHDELAEAFGRGHSLVVYQHFAPRAAAGLPWTGVRDHSRRLRPAGTVRTMELACGVPRRSAAGHCRGARRNCTRARLAVGAPARIR